MRKEYASLRRRPLMTPVWIFAALALLGLAAAAWAVYGASTTLVIVTRHAEQVAGDGPDPELTPGGMQRADRLAEILGAVGGPGAVDAVFITQWRRSAQTARPLATRLGVPVITLPAADLAALEARIFAEYRGKRVLVIGHSNTVPQLVRELADGGEYPEIAHDEFGTAYVVAVPRWSRPAVLRLRLP